MPSLRKRVSSYFRQLSFYNEPRERSHNINENSFITKYLEGHISIKEGPPILYGKNPTDLPNYDLALYDVGHNSTVGCYSGPNGGLTTIKRLEKHLSIPDTDIDFIDTPDDVVEVLKSPVNKSPVNNKVDNMTMLIKVAGQEYLVTNSKKRATNRSNSLGSLSDLEIEKTKICVINNNDEEVKCKNQELFSNSQNDSNILTEKTIESTNKTVKQCLRRKSKSPERTIASRNYSVTRSKSDGTPFVNKKKGKLTRIAKRPTSAHATTTDNIEHNTDPNLPIEWNHKTDCIYGISDSLYDKNLISQFRNGEPIADCFGILARKDSAILAVADGVNWGEKACIAAKSAVHGCLHYLDKTIFNDSAPFDNLCKNETTENSVINHNRINNTRDIFICLLRAFNCAHDLILENEGMLTTLTVAIVLPLKPKTTKTVSKFRDHRGDSLHRGRPERLSSRQYEESQSYVCCVCNVGDTLAYVYSQKYGMRELTKGSHDVNCNRDMRDALGALGPVDGINPELSNLTLSVTTVQKGDIILVASDGLTDNFDPNVCKFTVNAKDSLRPKRPSASQQTQHPHNKENERAIPSKVPVKPPRKNKDSTLRPARERSVDSMSSAAKPSTSRPKSEEYDNPLIAQFMQDNSFDKTRNSLDNKSKPSQIKSAQVTRTIPTQSKTNFLRSKTTIEMRTSAKTIVRNEEGVPYVSPMQRYEISLLLMEDVLKHGISGHDAPCTTARKLCENLVKFAFSISSAKRHTLEDADLYFNNVNGVLVEVSQNEKKVRRKKGLERVQNLPGKLDHVTVVAYNVGNFAY